ncbi:hypothetical protein GCM10027610_087620 [Dactylosporangium cerinum]
MRKLIYLVAVTLDGFIAGPDAQADFFGFDGDSAAAVLADWPETMPTHLRARWAWKASPTGGSTRS